MRRLFAVLIAVLAILNCTACKVVYEDGDIKIVDERYGDTEWALEQLRLKYGESFECVRSVTGDLSPTQFYAKCASLDDSIFVEVSHHMENAKNVRVLRDNYVAAKYKDEVCAWIKQYCDAAFGSTIVDYGEISSYALFQDFSADTTFAEYFHTENIRLDVQVGIPSSKYLSAKQYEPVVTDLLSEFKGTALTVTFVVLSDSLLSSTTELARMVAAGNYVSKATLDVFSTARRTFTIEENGEKRSYDLPYLYGVPITFD